MPALTGKGLLTPGQEDLFFILKDASFETITEQAVQKDPGFDLYWFAIALNRSKDFPDEPERWPVKMLVTWNPVDIKLSFEKLAVEILAGLKK